MSDQNPQPTDQPEPLIELQIDQEIQADLIAALVKLVNLQLRIEQLTRTAVDSGDVRWEATRVALKTILAEQQRLDQKLDRAIQLIKQFELDQA